MLSTVFTPINSEVEDQEECAKASKTCRSPGMTPAPHGRQICLGVTVLSIILGLVPEYHPVVTSSAPKYGRMDVFLFIRYTQYRKTLGIAKNNLGYIVQNIETRSLLTH